MNKKQNNCKWETKRRKAKNKPETERGGGAENSVRNTAPMFIFANYNRKKSLLISATVLHAVSAVKAVANTANCRLSELVGEAAYTDW